MKVYCERPMNYGPHDEHVLRLLTGQAAILLANSQSLAEARRLSRRLTEALARRDDVAQAIGVLLAQGDASEQDAFTTLTTAAQRTGRPVQDVARALVAAVAARNPRPGADRPRR
jgi:AmiR/NasT family two-component response regulator